MANDNLTEQSSRLGDSNNIDNTSIEMKIFPNPSNGLINISLDTDYEDEQSIRVLDISGRTINELRFTSAKDQVFKIDLTDLTEGIYLVEYKNVNVSSLKK